jgi:protein gp37
MGDTTAISWCHSTFNPWEGCTRIAPECDHCYAAARDQWLHRGIHWGAGAPRRRTSASNWMKPFLWNERQRKRLRSGQSEPWRVFGGSLMDWADNEVDPQWRSDFWGVIRETPCLTWLLLTKRGPNIAKMLPQDFGQQQYGHVWLGTTAGTQTRLDTDGMRLLDIDARVLFLSIEPQLEFVDLSDWLAKAQQLGRKVWCIVGAESGRGARGFDLGWPRLVLAQCKVYDVPVFVKQLGARPYERRAAMGRTPGVEHALANLGAEHPQRPWFKNWTLIHQGTESFWERAHQLKHAAGADPAEWPDDLRVQEFPL